MNKDPNSEPCIKCEKLSWIYILKRSNEKETKIYYCIPHYIDLLKDFLDDNLDNNLDIFPKELDLLNLPIRIAQIQYSSNIPIKHLLTIYMESIATKLEKIEKELLQLTDDNKNDESSSQYFVDLIKKDRNEKMLIKLLTQCFIKKNKEKIENN
ncbi:MAG: hypothetical protein GF364_18330 [Candidatus Lokiarchaeota archaeon]|nr:hypothetical protein [Candidatus Lokiarchaeota archaeon]